MTYQEYIDKLNQECGGRGGHKAAVDRFMSRESPQWWATTQMAAAKDNAYYRMMDLVRSKDSAKYAKQY